VFDAQGAVLNIPEFAKLLYQIQRVREDNGGDGKVIELWTDSFYAVQLAQGFLRYFKTKSEGLLRLNVDLSAKAEQGPFGFYFTRFAMDYPRVELRIVTSKFFDDMVDAAKKVGSMDSSGRVLWVLDGKTNYKAIIASNTVTNRSGDISQLAAVSPEWECVMKVPKHSTKLISVTDTNVAECPQASALFEGLSSEVPEHEGPSGDESDYTGLYTG